MPSAERIWTAGIVVIGDEILSGRTEDRNVAQIGKWLNVQGIRLKEVRIVGDAQDAIVAAVNAMRGAYDYCFTTGGIGPTHDDITVDAIAAAFGREVVIHPEARALLEAYYATRGGLNEGRLAMARVPQGATLIDNPVSKAPGIQIDNVFILAGIPHIAAGMLEGLTGKLEGGRPLVSVTVGAYAPESEVADLLRDVERSIDGVAVGSYPFFKEGRVGSNFVVRSEDEARARGAAETLADRLGSLGFETVNGGI
jgi:molybdenum cofactor synthesis domain-containing protein